MKSVVTKLYKKRCDMIVNETKEGRKIPKEQSNSEIENKPTTPWLKMKKTNRQTIVHMTQHRKLKNTQHESHPKLEVISGAPEG